MGAFEKGRSAELIGGPGTPCWTALEVNENTCATLIVDVDSITINELANILQILRRVIGNILNNLGY